MIFDFSLLLNKKISNSNMLFMKFNLIKTGLPLAMLGVLTGCVDNKYDLSDIDTTSRVNVNNLVVPMKLDNIVLNDIIKIDENDPDGEIKIMEVDGKKIYAVSQMGDISSDPIKINGFNAAPPTVQDATLSLNLMGTRSQDVTNTYSFDNSTPQAVDIRAENVDESIESITDITMDPLHIVMHLTTTGLDANTTMKFNKLQINFLKGLTIANATPRYDSYDPATGVLTFSNLDCPNRDLTINIDATGVNMVQSKTALAPDHSLTYHSDVDIKDAEIITVTRIDGAPAPSTLDFTVATTVGQLIARSFSGHVDYTFTGNGLNIEPIDLNDVPDFLGQEDTYMVLANPQIYLQLDNPLASCHAEYSTGLSLTSNRPGEASETYALNPGCKVEVSYNHGAVGPYNYVLSPNMPTSPLAEYTQNITHVPYSSLSNVVAGNGLPKTIDINLLNPGMNCDVKNLELRDTNDPDTDDTSRPGVYAGVEGKYEFFAPLAFANNGEKETTIIYRKDDTGWGDEDLDKLTIETLELDLAVVNNVPLQATLYVYPLKKGQFEDDIEYYYDKEGKKICGTALLAISSDSQNVTLTITDEDGIKELDGMRFEAVVHAKDGETLSPDQTITVSSSKAKVSGYYTTDF